MASTTETQMINQRCITHDEYGKLLTVGYEVYIPESAEADNLFNGIAMPKKPIYKEVLNRLTCEIPCKDVLAQTTYELPWAPTDEMVNWYNKRHNNTGKYSTGTITAIYDTNSFPFYCEGYDVDVKNHKFCDIQIQGREHIYVFLTDTDPITQDIILWVYQQYLKSSAFRTLLDQPIPVKLIPFAKLE